MTEAEWLGLNDLFRMAHQLDGKGYGRRFQLFACACCRGMWHAFTDERSRRAVHVAELLADGLIRPALADFAHRAGELRHEVRTDGPVRRESIDSDA